MTINPVASPTRPATSNTPEVSTDAPAVEPSMFDLPEWTGIPSGASTPNDDARDARQQLVGVRFQPVGKVYHYRVGQFTALKVGDWVVVDTVRGRQMGQIATVNPPKDKSGGPYKTIERLATGRDMAMRHYYQSKELEAMIACRAESKALDLPIKIAKAEYSFDGQTLTFMFSTDQEERMEVSELRNAMSRLYRARIEMRQISPREVAKIIGGMGACGIENRCCSRFLTEFSPISIKHAKEQGLSLNPHDITGMCGRLRCCLIYEYEQYVEARRHLPKIKKMIGTPMGQGKVIDVLAMRDSVLVEIPDGEGYRRVEFHREQLIPLEEFQRLQEKAASGTCDKHEGGGCDCGKDGKKASGAEPKTEGNEPPLSKAAQEYIAVSEAKQAEEAIRARTEVRREKIKAKLQARDDKRAQLRALAKQRRATEGTLTDAPVPEAEPPAAPQPAKRDQLRGRQRERDQRRGQIPPQRVQSEHQPTAPLEAGEAPQPPQPEGRPARKPLLPRRSQVQRAVSSGGARHDVDKPAPRNEGE